MAEAQFLFVPPREPTKIGVIEVDVMIESEFNLESEVSEYPVEDGFVISDNVTQKPIKLSLVVMISPMPVTWYENFKETAQDRVFNAVDELYWIWQRREPITIVTKLNVWENMVMTSCPIRRTKEDGIALKAAIDFVQIIKVDTKIEQIPAEYVDLLTKPKAQASNTDAGTAETTNISNDSSSSSNDGAEATTEKRQSTLASIFGGK
jgi:hypothetical protein